MNLTLPSRIVFLGIALFCSGLLVLALVLQYFVQLAPCPLCIVQRFFYFLIAITAFSLYFGWVKQVSVRTYSLLVFLLSVLGGMVAARQVWLQHVPPSGDTKCFVGGGSFVNSVILALGGTGNCAIRDSFLFGLSIAEWSLASFSILLIVSVLLMRNLVRKLDGEKSPDKR